MFKLSNVEGQRGYPLSQLAFLSGVGFVQIPIGCSEYNINMFFPLVVHAWRYTVFGIKFSNGLLFIQIQTL